MFPISLPMRKEWLKEGFAFFWEFMSRLSNILRTFYAKELLNITNCTVGIINRKTSVVSEICLRLEHSAAG